MPNIPYKGKPTRVVEFRDISDQKKAEREKEELEDQLMQAQKLESVGRLAGGVAHDFNNMLGIIIGFSELSINSLEEDSPLREYLGEILDAAERSMEISAQLLAFARKQTIKPSVIDINRTIENMLKMLKRLIGENISLNWHPGRGCRPVRIDPAQMNQILANLSVNARDAISDVGVITISTENVLLERKKSGVSPGEYVRLTFTDSGQGMTEEVRQNIFEPFYTTKQAGKGTGLGLSTVYGIVKQNGGCIGVESSPGKGTTFSIHFPPAESIPNKKTDQTVQRETPRASEHELILLVEDEPGMRSMVSAMLRELDYEVLTAETPEHAIEIAAKEGSRIDLLLTDVIMPSMNGRDLAQRITALLPAMKVLYMSGYTSDVIGKDGFIEEDILYIQKPFSRQHLAVTLWEILQKDPS
nr:ATP-binding protein [uncultured Sphaerochaeta sp.]